MANKNLDHDLANQAYFNGGFILVHNVPKNTTVGLDWHEFLTDEKFMGFKMVPTDKTSHFFYANSSDQGAPDSRSGCLFKFDKPGQILNLEWDAENEILKFSDKSIPDVEYLKNIDCHLAAYSYDRQATKWRSLTANVVQNESIISWEPFYPVVPKYWFDTESSSTTAMEKYLAKDDSSWLLTSNKFTLDHLLSDFETSFIWFVLGQDCTAFDHWKQILKILSHCSLAFETNREKMKSFIRTLIIQLIEFPKDMFDVSQEENVLFNYLLKIHRLSIVPLPDRAKRLSVFVTEQFGWKFTEEEDIPDDEKPVVVQI